MKVIRSTFALTAFALCAFSARAQQAWQSQLGPAALEARQTHAGVDVVTLGDGKIG